MASIKDIIEKNVEALEKAQTIKGSISKVADNIRRMRKLGENAAQFNKTSFEK